MNMSVGIVFPQDEDLPLLARDFDALADYQSAVGGYVETVAVGALDVTFFVNEEAKLFRLDINHRATLFWWLHMPGARHRDYIAGDAVLVGPANDVGETLGVPEPMRITLLESCAFAVEMKITGLEDTWHRNTAAHDEYFTAAAWALSLAERWRQVEAVRVVDL